MAAPALNGPGGADGGGSAGPGVRARRVAAVGTSVAAVAGVAYALERVAARRWRVDEATLEKAGLSLPTDLVHHYVPTDDGGRIHAVERGQGPTLVLVHGVSLGIAIWAHQLGDLAERHRVIAVGQRGHGQSLAGDDGYSLERLADDLLEVLDALAVTDAVLVGHSMGGMVAQLAAVRTPERLRRHVRGMVLVATAAGNVPPGPVGSAMSSVATEVVGRGLRFAERRGRGMLSPRDLGAWLTRLSFGARARVADVELARSMTAAMSPSAMAGLLKPLLRFDVHDQLSTIDLPVLVVVGTRDALTPVHQAREIANKVPGAELVRLPGCGHLVMLERPAELDQLIESFATELVGRGHEEG